MLIVLKNLIIYTMLLMGSYDEKVSEKALANTMYSVSVYDDDKIIGYGRIIGDGICFLYIHDVMVIPKYQNKKIGSQIMNKLLEKVNQIKIENPYVRVYLGASKGKERFMKDLDLLQEKMLILEVAWY